MKALSIRSIQVIASLLACVAWLTSSSANAESAAAMRKSARDALRTLYRTTPGASALGAKAVGVLVFPEIVKGGFVVAAHYGNGVLFRGDTVAGYYNTTSGSVGYQAGIQTFGYALFFMTEEDLHYLDRSAGWELGLNPGITVVDRGMAKSLSTTTMQKGMYAFFFDQRGLMGGFSLQGSKITRIHPKS